ncbi:MAG: hypothetical protein HYS13_02435 [Planctomycetia bacterium]|nr:hypothetical protein [Planctomycetia bacterium]
MLRRFALAALLVLVAAPCFGQVKLERQHKEGSTHVTENTIVIEQELSIAGTDQKTVVDVRTTTKSESGQRDALGRLKVKDTIQKMQVSISAGGSDYMFDSANPDQTGTSAIEFVRDVHKAMMTNATTRTFDKDGKISAVEHEKDLLGSLSDNVKALVKGQFDPEALKKAVNQERDRLTTDPVKPGDSWQRTETTDVGAGQLLTFDTRYTYEGTVQHNGKPVEKVASKTLSVKFELAPDSPLLAQLKVKSSDLKTEESEGAILFDRALGAVVEETSSLRITGEIKFEVNNNELPAKLDLKMRTGNVVKQ